MHQLSPRLDARGRCLGHRQGGLSLVELLVGVAIGLFVVAGAATVTATQFSDSRRLVVETQIQQDLRATADIITREIRRAGQWNGVEQSVWAPGVAVLANSYADVTQTSVSNITISRSPPAASASPTALGFRLGNSPRAVEMNVSGSGWQALTDSTTMDVEALRFDIATVPLNLACPVQCPAGTPGGPEACWPQLEVREVQVSITARSRTDSNVVRSVRTAARLRNDRVVNRNGGGPLCPV